MRAGLLKIMCGILVVILSITGYSYIFTDTGKGNVSLEEFKSGSSYEVTFPIGGGTDNKTVIQLPTDANVLSATMRVTGEADNGIYPMHVAVDVGEDGVIEWKFDEIEPNWAGALAAMRLKRSPEEVAKANAFFEAMPIDEKIDPDMRVCEALHAYYLFRDDPALASLLSAGRARAVREQIQYDSIRRLDEGIPVPRLELPLLSTPDFRREQVETLSRLIEEGFGGGPKTDTL